MLVGYEWRAPIYRVWIPDDPENPNPMSGRVIVRADIVVLENTGYWNSIKQANAVTVHKMDEGMYQDQVQLLDQHNAMMPNAAPGDVIILAREDNQHRDSYLENEDHAANADDDHDNLNDDQARTNGEDANDDVCKDPENTGDTDAADAGASVDADNERSEQQTPVQMRRSTRTRPPISRTTYATKA